MLAGLISVLRGQPAEQRRALDRGLGGELGINLLSQRGGELGRPPRPRVFAKLGFPHDGHGLLVNDAPLGARWHPAEPLNAVGVQTRVPSAQNQRASGGGIHGQGASYSSYPPPAPSLSCRAKLLAESGSRSGQNIANLYGHNSGLSGTFGEARATAIPLPSSMLQGGR